MNALKAASYILNQTNILNYIKLNSVHTVMSLNATKYTTGPRSEMPSNSNVVNCWYKQSNK